MLADRHLNFLRTPGAPRSFGAYLRQEKDFEAVVISGDIAEAPTVRALLLQFAEGVGVPTYFVLGNHDYYRGSFAGVRKDLEQGLPDNLVWLDRHKPILLDDMTALVGHQGWFDGIYGDPTGSQVIMSDFDLIEDLRIHYDRHLWGAGVVGRISLLQELRSVSALAAYEAQMSLLPALELRRDVVFVTHFPPFPEACWHEGAMSDRHWLPWFTSGNMGSMLCEVAESHPNNQIFVLCGHTHSPGVYEHAPNMTVLTGKAVYGAPGYTKIFELPRKHRSPVARREVYVR
jgi:predicted phosphodiesterase